MGVARTQYAEDRNPPLTILTTLQHRRIHWNSTYQQMYNKRLLNRILLFLLVEIRIVVQQVELPHILHVCWILPLHMKPVFMLYIHSWK